jgi:TolB-like protein/DNA-binding winged helix-turn-helix (wHTH) protein/Tfp pilus assembly protein PilF
MQPPSQVEYRFGPFSLNSGEKVLLCQGRAVALTAKAFEILMMLVQNPGHSLAKEEMLRQVWPDSFVDESNLAQHIFQLRKILEEAPGGRAYIETIPRYGYRFTQQVQQSPAPSDEILATAPAAPANASVGRADETAAKPRWIIAAALATVVTVAAVGIYVANERASNPSGVKAGKVMLAVLPFENLSRDAQQEYLSNGLTEEMITQLGNLEPERLGVIARTSAMQYKDSHKDIRQISRELGVDYILEGSVRREGDQVRITAQLIQVRDQTHLWAKEYDRNLRDILALQSDVAGSVAREIQLRLTPQQTASLAAAHAVDPQAYELYLKGRYLWNKRNEAAYVKAIDFFDQAIARDPQYARAYSGLADAYALLGSWPNAELPRHVAMPRAKEAALTALKLDDSLAESHASLAFVEMQYEWNWAASEQEFRRAIALNPNYATAHQWFATWLMVQGHADDSIAEIELARKADPLSIIIRTDAVDMLCAAGRFDEAIAQAHEALELDPNFLITRYFLGVAYVGKKMYPEALIEYQKGVAIDGSDEWSRAGLGHVYALLHDRANAEKIVQQLLQDSRGRSDLALELAAIYAALDEKDQAFAWLDKAYQNREGGLMFLNTPLSFDGLRSDPRFTNLIRKMGLPRANGQ